MSVTDATQTVVETAHALLVAYGRFAQQIGLPHAVEQVALKMKTIEHRPQHNTLLGECPYPLRLFICKQWWGDKRPERWSSLVATPSLLAKDWPIRRIGVFSNGRQTIEAGIKEGNGIFASRHLPTRHQEEIAFYQELVLFAQNLVRWFRRQFLGYTLLAAASIKELVRVGANSCAQIRPDGHALTLTFAADSPWQDISLCFGRNVAVSYQLALPFLDEWAAVRT